MERVLLVRNEDALDAGTDADIRVAGLDDTTQHDVGDLAGGRFGLVNHVNLVENKRKVLVEGTQILHMGTTIRELTP